MYKWFEKHPLVVLVVGVLGISVSAIFVKYSTAPSVVTAAARMLCSVLLVAPMAAANPAVRAELKRLSAKTLALCAASGCFLAAHFCLWFESLAHTSVASSTAIVCTEVIWVSLGFCLFLGGRIRVKELMCIAVVIGGSVLIALSDSAAGGGHLYGDLLALAGAMVVAVYTLIGRQLRAAGLSNTAYTFVVYAACALVLVFVSLVQGHSLTGWGPSPWLVGLGLGLFSTILGHSIFSWVIKYLSPPFVSASKLCEPVVAAILAVPLFGEWPRPLQLLGGALVLGGVMVYARFEQKQEEHS